MSHNLPNWYQMNLVGIQCLYHVSSQNIFFHFHSYNRLIVFIIKLINSCIVKSMLGIKKYVIVLTL